MTNEWGFRTLADIAPETFKAARERTKREEREYTEIIGLRKGCMKGKEKEAELQVLRKKCDEAYDAYFDLVRPINDWKCHILAFSGWTGALFGQKEVTLDDIVAMITGTENFEKGTVELEDGRVFRAMQDDAGYYTGDDGSVITAVDLIRTDKDGEPTKVEARLGYVSVNGTYESMPY